MDTMTLKVTVTIEGETWEHLTKRVWLGQTMMGHPALDLDLLVDDGSGIHKRIILHEIDGLEISAC